MTNYAGIDYGMGRSNVDPETGIRYGVISQHSVMSEALDDVEYDYPGPNCPKCGNDAVEYDPDEHQGEGWECGWYEGRADFACPSCKYLFTSEEAYGDEPTGFHYEQDGYELMDCLDSDIFILKSPFYTFAQFCSPCVPGAGNLDNPMPEGVKCYCLGHDWFEESIAPYPVYRISDGVQIKAERREVDCSPCFGTGRRSTVKLAEIRNETVEECEERITSNLREGQTLDTASHTVTCWVCDGSGRVTETIEEEVEG